MSRPIRIFAGALIAATFLSAQAAAEQPSPQMTYETCLLMAQQNPKIAREKAAQWRALGGAGQARHCGALALIGLGAEQHAAEELTNIGIEETSLGAPDRASALALAGDLWLRLGQTQLAAQVFQRITKLAPESPAGPLGHARSIAADGDWPKVTSLLDAALDIWPQNPEALTLRAAALRRMGRPSEALPDAVLATELAPGAALAWFERGAAERAMKANASARESWLRASILDPNGPAGEMARLNLQRMDLPQ